jgi:hypothetical protein
MLLKKSSSCLLAAMMAAATCTIGCTVHAGYYNDPYYHDHHPYGGETVYYSQWETETHREHRDFKERKKDEQKQYWDWRHHHDDHH